MTRTPFALAILAFAAWACATDPAPDYEADRQAIAEMTADTEAAENAGSVERMRVHFADDLVMMAPGMPAVEGAEAVAEAMQAYFDAFEFQVEYDSEEIEVFGDWAFDRGTGRQVLVPKDGGPAIEETAKYLWLYRRQADGSWKQSRVIWNSNDPPPAP